MNRYLKFASVALAVTVAAGCARIESGEVGLRVGFDKQVSPNELLPGTFNQTLIGDVLHFQVRSIAIQIDNKNPQTADNSTLKDFDVTAIYDITPSSVSELWVKQSRSFHSTDKSGEHFLMYNYMTNIINSAMYKAVRQYKALEVADNRSKIEQDIKVFVLEALKEEKLEGHLALTQVQVRNAVPADDIVASANNVVRATNDFKTKVTEVQTAEQESKRLALLSNNAKNIDYMNAKSLSDIAEGVKLGKVNTVLIPIDFRGMVSVNTK